MTIFTSWTIELRAGPSVLCLLSQTPISHSFHLSIVSLLFTFKSPLKLSVAFDQGDCGRNCRVPPQSFSISLFLLFHFHIISRH